MEEGRSGLDGRKVQRLEINPLVVKTEAEKFQVKERWSSLVIPALLNPGSHKDSVHKLRLRELLPLEERLEPQPGSADELPV